MTAWRASHLAVHAAYQRAYRKRSPEVVKASLTAWHEKHPEYERERARRRYADNPERQHAATKRWVVAHPDQNRLSVRAASQRRRARLLNAPGRGITKSEVESILKAPCFYCGGQSDSLDHVVPVSRGGRHEPENVVAACRRCNSSKHDRLLSEWKPRIALRQKAVMTEC